METFIRAIVNLAIGGVRELAAAAMERMLWLYAVVVTVGTAIRFGWNTVTSSARFWAAKVWNFSGQVYATFWYIIHIRIPTFVNTAIDNTVTWVSAVIQDVEMRLTIGLMLLRQWVVDRVNEFTDFIGRLVSFVVNKFDEVWDSLGRIGELVFTLLTSPERMAAWLFGALVRHIISYVDENAEGLLDLFQRKSMHYAGRIAMRIEQVLVRLL